MSTGSGGKRIDRVSEGVHPDLDALAASVRGNQELIAGILARMGANNLTVVTTVGTEAVAASGAVQPPDITPPPPEQTPPNPSIIQPRGEQL